MREKLLMRGSRRKINIINSYWVVIVDNICNSSNSNPNSFMPPNLSVVFLLSVCSTSNCFPSGNYLNLHSF